MFNWFKNALKIPTGLIGLDIGTAAIKLTQFCLVNGKHQLVYYAVAPLPVGVIDTKDIKNVNVAVFTKLLAHMFAETPRPSRNVAIAIPDDLVISKVIQLDAGLTESEIETHIMLEADKHIAYPIDEINLDFQIQGNSSQYPEMVDVLLVAVRKDTVSARIDAINAADLTVSVIDVESYAINRAVDQLVLDDANKQNVTAVLDIGATMMRLIILQNGHRVFVRSEILNLSDSNIITIEMILPKLQRMLQLFFSSHQYDKVHRLFLAGGTALLPGLENALARALHISVSLINPFALMEVAENINKNQLYQLAPRLLLSCGLGLR